eukprot:comp8306_c0_seq1/m.3707 comp8306_c0_seq1/g.3707  ORF comp8306_c0_seq1/g.3707 comp8306_c0_seq1/m.3707 type:complete len:155 (-) comp8306_c0_seq1:604-1068(-)
MSVVNLLNVVIPDNPTAFLNQYQFEITFECHAELSEDLEFRVTYVGSAESEKHDQILDSILVGPVPKGINRFVFQANPPDVTRIPADSVTGVTVLLLTCSYKKQEFVRVGYYVNVDYTDPEMRDNPPPVTEFDKLFRNILTTKPCVTRFDIEWD